VGSPGQFSTVLLARTGGQQLAKILVADDNSNIQRSVAQALAELGVDIVSVNNGEAAVRKLSDYSPDLVLADIFMPVRNGYEVCEYIKKAPRFAHVPVILLVGAFDPFDEREAQRVGADGILKKPFVPPNPLITMVKTLLDSAISQRLVGVSAFQDPAAVSEGTASRATAEIHAPVPEVDEESLPQEFPAPAGRVAFGEGERPVAFSHMLAALEEHTSAPDAGSTEPAVDEPILTDSRDASLGEPIFWRNDASEMEPENPQSTHTLVELEIGTPEQGEDSPPLREEASPLEPVEQFEIVREEQDQTPSRVDSGTVVLDPAAQAQLNVDAGEVPELVKTPIEWMATAPVVESKTALEMTIGRNEPIVDHVEAISNLEPSAHFESAVEPAAHSSDEPIFQAAPSDLTSEDAARPLPQNESSEPVVNVEPIETTLEMQQNAAVERPSAQIALPAQEVSQTANAGTNPSQPPDPDPALVEAVVQRVLERMGPQVVDIITRELLRPVVLALVHREIAKR
jgi:CheY-like chemotaxis protein